MNFELPVSIADNIQYFTGRTWLLSKIASWLGQPDQRIFLLTGGPGTGKSMISAWLAGAGPAPTDPAARLQLEQIRSQVAAVHFCMSASRNISPRAVTENITNQLARNVKKFGDALVATLAERVQITVSQQINSQSGGNITGVSIGRLDLGALDDESSFDRAFTQPIKKLYAGGYDQNMILLFDALDEAQTYAGSSNLTQILSELTDLPPQVRLILTTRSDPRVLKYFRNVPGSDLITDALADANDVHKYLAQRLATELPALDGEKRLLLVDRIGAVAKGVFLYGHMVLGDILAHQSNLPDLVNYPLPEGLAKLYQDFLNRELGRVEERWYETFQPLLGLTAVSQGSGLSRTQLSRILSTEVDASLRACKQYLAGDIPEGPFRIFDRSFTDFLLNDAENTDYHIDEKKMHRRICDYYLQNYSQDWSTCDSYGLNHLIEHVLASGMSDQERKAAFDRILTDEFVNAIQESHGWLYAFIEDLEALAMLEPTWAAKLCFTLILDRPPNSVVVQRALQLLVKLRPNTGSVGTPDTPREESLDKIVAIFSDKAGDVPSRLMESLPHETDSRVRGVIALALAETKDPSVAACLLEMFKNEFGEVSWAAADALITLNHRAVIPELVRWYQELNSKRDRRSTARKDRILYVLGWMHAEEARTLMPLAFASPDPKIVGRAVDFSWQLQPAGEDESYLRDQLRRVLASPPELPKQLGPWADEWVQKRLVRSFQRLRMTDTLPGLRSLLEHIHHRPTPKEGPGIGFLRELGASKRERLVEAVEEAITDLQVGR